MLNNNLRELEQITDRLPDRTFTHKYSSGVGVTLWHDNMWRGEITGVNNAEPCHAQTFQEVADRLRLYGLMDQNMQELLDAAKKQLAGKG